MKKLRWLGILMAATLLGIIGFQGYWLKENYDREKKALSIKSDMTFRETMQDLQVAKLKLDGLPFDSTHKGKVKLIMTNEGKEERVNVRFTPKGEMISTINVIREKMRDSLVKKPGKKNGMIISMNKEFTWSTDSIRRAIPVPTIGPGRGDLIQILYGVDSLQDTLKLAEIRDAYSKSMKEQKLEVPFTISRLDSNDFSHEPALNEVTIGFANPITYRLELGNTFPYLIKRISMPILFSIFLLGITILSFILLYRNLVKQRRLAELKNEFISNITHELKTPIATVGVAIEALRNFNAIENPARTKEYLDISSNELQRLSLLVDKVLKLSMFEKKEIDLKYEDMSVQDIIDEVVASLRLQLEKYHAKVSIKTEGNTFIKGDRLHLQSVIFNLLDNALKYGKREPVISIDVKGNDDEVNLSVTDNGIGIPDEYKDRVFDKFFRVPHGDTHNAKGYGLGLSYVAQVIQKHKGTIQLASVPGNGTTFTITLPKTANG